MRKEIVTLTDDLDAMNGEITEADGTVRIGLNGKWYELDLSEENNSALITFMTPYLIAGRDPGKDTRPPGPNKGKKYDRRSAEYYAGLREWCAENNIEYDHANTHGALLTKRKYDEYLAGKAE